VSFEQDRPDDDSAKPADSAADNSVPSSDQSPSAVADHDSWVAEWAKKNSSKKDATSNKSSSTPEKDDAAAVNSSTDAESAADAETSSEASSPQDSANVDADARPKGSSKFASAVGDFVKRTPVRLDAKTKAELTPLLEAASGKPSKVTPIDDSDLVFESDAQNKPTTLRGKIARAFTSDKTTAALGVFGELLITGGAVVLLFLAWQLWINNAIVAGEQAEAVKNFSKNITASPSSSSLWTPKAGAIDYGPPPVLAAVGQNEVIGNLYVPRLGSGSTRAVANGVSDPGATINRGYYGKYENSQWPGEPGNFAMAVHRTGWGTSFTQAQTIRPGDHMYLETPQGWYIYTVRNTEYVVPTQVNVVNPMPLSDSPPVNGQSILTITTCSPMNGNGERLVVYGLLTSWQPLEAGVPTEITKLVEEARA